MTATPVPTTPSVTRHTLPPSWVRISPTEFRHTSGWVVLEGLRGWLAFNPDRRRSRRSWGSWRAACAAADRAREEADAKGVTP